MECDKGRVSELLREVNAEENEPIETYRTMIEENCFAQAKVFRLGDSYLVYMVDEERACVEVVGSLGDAREVAKRFTDSVCA
jgi:aspartate/tyrosine/aromatic aminotransferase